MRRAPGQAGGPLHAQTDGPRQPHNVDLWDFGPPLDWPEDPAALPYLDGQDNVIVPMSCPRRFRWWQKGQSIEKTLEELRDGQKKID